LAGHRRLLVKVAAGVCAFAAVGGVAYAASGSSFIGSHGNINTCVPPGGGEVNVWKPGHRCSGGRVGLAFPAHAQSGTAGPAGPAGPSGPTGATGPVNTNATTVDGENLVKLSLREATPGSGTTSQTLWSNDGLTITASCDSGGAASLTANGPSTADSELTFSGYDSSMTPSFGGQIANLGPSSAAALGPAGSGEVSFSYASNGGPIVTATVGYQHASSYGSSYAGCAFFGTLVYG
jgi:hypothetical protein